MALRLLPEEEEEQKETKGGVESNSTKILSLPRYVSPLFGSIAGVVGVVSVVWAAAARPELGGDLSSRFTYFSDMASTDRVFWAFCVDSVLYSVWQAWLLGDAGAKTWQRFVPFFGMVGYLLENGTGNENRKN